MKRATGPKGKADELFSQLVRSRGYCENCGRVEYLQCAHVITRSRLNVRWDNRNAWCLCSRCHIWFTNWPVEHTRFMERTIGQEVYDELYLLSQTDLRPWRKADFVAECVRLQALLDEGNA